MVGERALVAVDEGHAIGGGIGAKDAAFAQRQRLEPGKELLADELSHVLDPIRIDAESRMDIEAVAAARARCRAEKTRMPIGYEHHAREITAEQRFERDAQLGELGRQRPVQDLLRDRKSTRLNSSHDQISYA